MKKLLGILMLSATLTLTGMAQTATRNTVVIDGNQNLEVGGLTLHNGTLEAGSLTITNVDRIELGDDGVRIFRQGQEPIYFPRNDSSNGNQTLQEGLENLDKALGY